VLRVYLAAVVVFIKASKAPMAKPPDHGSILCGDNCHLSKGLKVAQIKGKNQQKVVLL